MVRFDVSVNQFSMYSPPNEFRMQMSSYMKNCKFVILTCTGRAALSADRKSRSVGDVPLGDMPLDDMTLGDMPLGDMPLGVIPLGEVAGEPVCAGDMQPCVQAGTAREPPLLVPLEEGGYDALTEEHPDEGGPSSTAIADMRRTACS